MFLTMMMTIVHTWRSVAVVCEWDGDSRRESVWALERSNKLK